MSVCKAPQDEDSGTSPRRWRRSVVTFAASALTVWLTTTAQAQVFPVSSALCQNMRAHRVMSATPAAPCARLALVRFAYVDFSGRTHDDGQVVVLDAVADAVFSIFWDLRERRFPIAGARLMDAFEGDDDASMAANNTSAYNDRAVAGRSAVSVHAYGCAIDLNPVQNPYVTRGEIAPPAGAAFLKRKPAQPGMAEAVVGIFARHGFSVWGGRWRSETDYQHFQVDRALAARLVAASPEEARRLFRATLRR